MIDPASTQSAQEAAYTPQSGRAVILSRWQIGYASVEHRSHQTSGAPISRAPNRDPLDSTGGVLLSAALLLASKLNVGRWDAYGGYSRLMQPSINLAAPGFNIQVGMRPANWITFGFDYTFGRGQNTVVPGMLLPSVQNGLGALLGELAGMGLVPPGYQLAVPFNFRTQAFQLGPDFPFRHFQAVTFFVRPNLGALEAVATARPADPIAALVVSRVIPTGKKTEWTYFSGFGGGLEFNVQKHFALRFQADFARDHFFNDLLRAGNTIRFSVGPAFQWGKNKAGR